MLEQLYRYTPLEDSFNINNVALVDGGPKTLGLIELLQVYIQHRLSVVTRRSRYRLARRRERLHLVDGLLIAILDIDEVIQVIRTSDDTEQARARLMDVFELTEIQAEYILELRLRRLTKFSRVELEAEQDQLRREIAELEQLLSSDSNLRALVSDELGEVAERFGTPRRTLLTEARPSAATAGSKKQPVSLELADTPCIVYLSTTGRAVRVDVPEEPSVVTSAPRRAKHDSLQSSIATTSRTEIGAVTTAGRLVRMTPLDLPVVPENSVQLGAGVRMRDYLGLSDKKERVLALVDLASARSIVLGTAQGVVKRVTTDYPSNKEDWEVIALRDGDEVVGAVELRTGEEDLVFITSDAQLLRFGADKVRPQGRPAGGVAGIALAPRARVVWFGAVDLSVKDGEWGSAVVTISGSTSALPGTQPGAAKVTPFAEYPRKGRATGGVRCHRFLKGEDTLLLAWAGPSPARAAAANGVAVDLPEPDSRRDGSGTPLRQPVAAVAGPAGR